MSHYAGTHVTPEESKLEIEKLLQEFDAKNISWNIDHSNNKLEVLFSLEANGKKRFIRKVQRVSVRKRKEWNRPKGKYETLEFPDWPPTYRKMLGNLKAKLIEVKDGADIDDEFMSNVVIMHSQHGLLTGLDFFRHALTSKLVALPSNVPALTGPPTPAPQVQSQQTGPIIDLESHEKKSLFGKKETWSK